VPAFWWVEEESKVQSAAKCKEERRCGKNLGGQARPAGAYLDTNSFVELMTTEGFYRVNLNLQEGNLGEHLKTKQK
jgi:hypothetical protein